MRRFWFNEEQKLLFGFLVLTNDPRRENKEKNMNTNRPFRRHTMMAYVASIVCRFQASNCGLFNDSSIAHQP